MLAKTSVMLWLLAVSLLGNPLPPAAERDDLHELDSNEREDSGHEFLGWTDDGRVVARRMLCTGYDERTHCKAMLDRVAVDENAKVEVLADFWPDTVTKKQASAYARAERKALKALPNLHRGSHVDPETAFGSLGGEPIEVTVDEAYRDDEPLARYELVAKGPDGVSIILETVADAETQIDSGWVEDAFASPDGSDIALVASHEETQMGRIVRGLSIVVVSRGRVRAQLANELGMKRYEEGNFYAARALFRQATLEDENFVSGWYKQAALESVHGEVNASISSLQAALDLDPTKAQQACHDQDFESVRNSTRGAELLGCA